VRCLQGPEEFEGRDATDDKLKFVGHLNEMKTPTSDDLRGVFAVPPLARRNDAKRSIDFDQNERIVKHIVSGGISRLLYGGNAFLYHTTLSEFESLLEWLTGSSDQLWMIPSIGPSFGRALEQADLLRKHSFAVAMMLPCGDPRDAAGLEQGYREIADVAGAKLIVYLKDENNFGPGREPGLDAVARLVDDGVCVGIKYAVVRDDPSHDSYLEALLARVDRKHVISGIGERPALVHVRDWKLQGFTTGSGCIAPRLSQQLFERLNTNDYAKAEEIREKFLPLEDLRDMWGPARVLHHATELAGIAQTGSIRPYVSALSAEQIDALAPVVQKLVSEHMSDEL
jgi:dihydrodipicolinate synthase/N-acetylneuraminate lyase